MLQGFKDFIMKGNVLDLAVAVIIGAAFGKIVNALVEAVLMPLIAAAVGSPNFDSFAVLTVNGNDVKFGVLLTAIVNFLLIAAAYERWAPVSSWLQRHQRAIQVVGASLLIIVGTLLLTGGWDAIVQRLQTRLISDWEVPL